MSTKSKGLIVHHSHVYQMNKTREPPGYGNYRKNVMSASHHRTSDSRGCATNAAAANELPAKLVFVDVDDVETMIGTLTSRALVVATVPR